MHWESYYVRPQDVNENRVFFQDDEVRHLSRVQRHKRGDVVWAVNGQGVAYEVELVHVGRNEAYGDILSTRRRIGEPVADVTLVQGVLKGDRFDWLVEKATEIGVRRIIPLESENAVVQGGSNKVARWQRIALAAMKQSGRSVLPEITQPKAWKQILGLGVNCQYRFIAEASPESRPLSIAHTEGAVVTPHAILIVGPEGGFTSAEFEEAVEHAFIPVHLGGRRLRAETAGLVLSSLVLHQLGEMQ